MPLSVLITTGGAMTSFMHMYMSWKMAVPRSAAYGTAYSTLETGLHIPQTVSIGGGWGGI